MIRVTATITEGCTASLEIATVDEVVRYVRDHAQQAIRWEIIGTDEEEDQIGYALEWNT